MSREPRKSNMTDAEIFDWLMDGTVAVPAPDYVHPFWGPCMESQLSRTVPGGYARINYRGKGRLAHRWAYGFIHNRKPLPPAVRHICDNPACVNIRHLRGGSHAANMHDKVRKGRHYHGEDLHTHKLTEFTVRRIREEYAKGGVQQTELARRHKVSKNNIYAIVRGKIWKHVGGPTAAVGRMPS